MLMEQNLTQLLVHNPNECGSRGVILGGAGGGGGPQPPQLLANNTFLGFFTQH